MLTEVLRAFAFIFIAEMGDKTQILAMAFATKYDIKKVLLGIFIGVVLNHGIAVILGSAFSSLIPANTMQIIAGIAFVLFAFWSLKFSEESDVQKVKKAKYGPTVTVALAFFIGELGDKTQLTAITLAASSSYPALVLIGTVLGMVITGAIGIFIGIKLGSKVPEFFIKLGAAIVFFIVGFVKLYQAVPSEFNSPLYAAIFILAFLIISYFILRPTLDLRKKKESSHFQIVSEELSTFYRVITDNLESICLGESVCGSCQGTRCLIGYTKEVIRKAKANQTLDLSFIEDVSVHKNFDTIKVMQSLKITIYQCKDDPSNESYKSIHQVRKNLETILYGKYIEDFKTYTQYKKELYQLDKNLYRRLDLM